MADARSRYAGNCRHGRHDQRSFPSVHSCSLEVVSVNYLSLSIQQHIIMHACSSLHNLLELPLFADIISSKIILKHDVDKI